MRRAALNWHLRAPLYGARPLALEPRTCGFVLDYGVEMVGYKLLTCLVVGRSSSWCGSFQMTYRSSAPRVSQLWSVL